jgi:hypothetical protein
VSLADLKEAFLPGKPPEHNHYPGRFVRTGYPKAEDVILGRPVTCVQCGVGTGTLRKVSEEPARYSHDHSPAKRRRSSMTWLRYFALRS